MRPIRAFTQKCGNEFKRRHIIGVAQYIPRKEAPREGIFNASGKPAGRIPVTQIHSLEGFAGPLRILLIKRNDGLAEGNETNNHQARKNLS